MRLCGATPPGIPDAGCFFLQSRRCEYSETATCLIPAADGVSTWGQPGQEAILLMKIRWEGKPDAAETFSISGQWEEGFPCWKMSNIWWARKPEPSPTMTSTVLSTIRIQGLFDPVDHYNPGINRTFEFINIENFRIISYRMMVTPNTRRELRRRLGRDG